MSAGTIILAGKRHVTKDGDVYLEVESVYPQGAPGTSAISGTGASSRAEARKFQISRITAKMSSFGQHGLEISSEGVKPTDWDTHENARKEIKMDPWFLRCDPAVDSRTNVPWDEEGRGFGQCIEKYGIHFDGRTGLDPEDEREARTPARKDIHHWVPEVNETYFVPELSEQILWEWNFVNIKFEIPQRYEIERYLAVGRSLAGACRFKAGSRHFPVGTFGWVRIDDFKRSAERNQSGDFSFSKVFGLIAKDVSRGKKNRFQFWHRGGDIGSIICMLCGQHTGYPRRPALA